MKFHKRNSLSSSSGTLIYLSVFILSCNLINNVNGGVLDFIYSTIKNAPKIEVGLEYPKGPSPVQEIGFRPKPQNLYDQNSFDSKPQNLYDQNPFESHQFDQSQQFNQFQQPASNQFQQFKPPQFKLAHQLAKLAPFKRVNLQPKRPLYQSEQNPFRGAPPLFKEVTFTAPAGAPDSFPFARNTFVNFYFEENLNGKAKQVFLRKDKCMNVPTTYSIDKPRSVWASDCVMLFQKDFCHGSGVRVAGTVFELKSNGLEDGIGSVKPCEGNIQIQFNKG